ncbi:MAG: thiamine phosphate synthase [Pyrinomonadaceae bacterium]
MTLDLSRPLVCLITTGECEASNYRQASQQILNITSAAVEAGVDLIQLREKHLTGKLLHELTCRLVEITRDSQTKLLVNDRLDIALAAGADGVHLTSTSVPANVVRAHVPADFLLGVSCHSISEIASTDGADLILYGPVFTSPGKGEGVGVQALIDACQNAQALPVIAIGGIDETNCRAAIDAGAAGIAAIRSLNDTESMHRVLRELGR